MPIEKPIMEIAITIRLIRITLLVPKHLVTLSDQNAAKIVNPKSIIEMIPALAAETPRSTCIAGHALPKTFGNPIIINAT